MGVRRVGAVEDLRCLDEDLEREASAAASRYLQYIYFFPIFRVLYIFFHFFPIFRVLYIFFFLFRKFLTLRRLVMYTAACCAG